MAFYPAREALQKTLGFETSEKQPTSSQHYGSTILLSIVITLLGLYIRSVGKVYALIGGVAATTLAYILPAASYLATRSIRGQVHDESKQTLLQQHDNSRSYQSIGECSSSSSSNSSSDGNRPIIAVEEEPVVINLDDGSPCWYLDLAAGLLIVWGFVVMFYSTKGVFAQT